MTDIWKYGEKEIIDNYSLINYNTSIFVYSLEFVPLPESSLKESHFPEIAVIDLSNLPRRYLYKLSSVNFNEYLSQNILGYIY